MEHLAYPARSGFVPGLGDLPPGLDRLLRLIDGYIAALGSLDLRNKVFLMLWAESATLPELVPIFHERAEVFLAGLREDLTAGITDGTVHPGAAPEETPIAVLGQLRGTGLQRLPDPGLVDTERLRGPVTAHWRRALTRHWS